MTFIQRKFPLPARTPENQTRTADTPAGCVECASRDARCGQETSFPGRFCYEEGFFSIVECCKLNQINPREFVRRLITDIHEGKAPYTPTSLTTH